MSAPLTGECSVETPCVVQLETESESWMLLAGFCTVALLGAIFALSLANRGD